MGLPEYDSAKRLIDGHPDDADFEGPQSEDLVRAAEQKLGLIFPEAYRRFLLDFGCGSFGEDEIFGIMDDEFENSALPDAVWFTLLLRAEKNFPPFAVAVAELGEGEMIVLDSDPQRPTFGAVYLAPSADLSDPAAWEQIEKDFGDYFLALVQAAIPEE